MLISAKAKTAILLLLAAVAIAAGVLILGPSAPRQDMTVDAGLRGQTAEAIARAIAAQIFDTPPSPAAQTERLTDLRRNATPEAVTAISPALLARWSQPPDPRQRANMTVEIKPSGDIEVTQNLCTPDMNNCYAGDTRVLVRTRAGEKASQISLVSDK